MTKKLQTYPLRYVEDFFGVSNEVTGKLSKCATGNQFFTTLLDYRSADGADTKCSRLIPLEVPDSKSNITDDIARLKIMRELLKQHRLHKGEFLRPHGVHDIHKKGFVSYTIRFSHLSEFFTYN